MQDQTSPTSEESPGSETSSESPTAPISHPPATSGFDFQAFLQGYILTAKQVALSPQVFYANMPTKGGYAEPALFFGVSSVPQVLVSTILNFNPLFGLLSLGLGFVASFIGAGIGYGLAKAMGGKPESFEAVYRVYAFSGVVGLVTWVPIIGPLLGLYAIVLQYFGLKQVCGMTTGQTIAVCAIAGVLSLVVGLFLVIAMVIKAILGI